MIRACRCCRRDGRGPNTYFVKHRGAAGKGHGLSH